MNVHYIYTINGYLAVSLPYRPLYELCDWVECNKYQVFGQPPPIENGFTRKFTLREGWSEPIAISDLPTKVCDKIDTIQKTLHVYHIFLNFENSCKLRYIPLGYGNELMHRLIMEDERLLEAYAQMKKCSPDAVTEEMKLRKEEIINLFIFLCEVKGKILDMLERKEYEEAARYVTNEAIRLNL